MKEEQRNSGPEGEHYDSYKAYCNSPDLDMDLVQVKLWKGERTPQNDLERKLLVEIEQAKKDGKYLELYPN